MEACVCVQELLDHAPLRGCALAGSEDLWKKRWRRKRERQSDVQRLKDGSRSIVAIQQLQTQATHRHFLFSAVASETSRDKRGETSLEAEIGRKRALGAKGSLTEAEHPLGEIVSGTESPGVGWLQV